MLLKPAVFHPHFMRMKKGMPFFEIGYFPIISMFILPQRFVNVNLILKIIFLFWVVLKTFSTSHKTNVSSFVKLTKVPSVPLISLDALQNHGIVYISKMGKWEVSL